MNDVYEMAKVLAGDSSRKWVVDASDYGTMPTAEFVEAVFCTNDRNASRDVLAEVIATERKRGDFFRDALHALHFCPTVDDYPCKGRAKEPCPYMTGDGPDYAACWDEVERRQREADHE